MNTKNKETPEVDNSKKYALIVFFISAIIYFGIMMGIDANWNPFESFIDCYNIMLTGHSFIDHLLTTLSVIFLPWLIPISIISIILSDAGNDEYDDTSWENIVNDFEKEYAKDGIKIPMAFQKYLETKYEVPSKIQKDDSSPTIMIHNGIPMHI